MKVVRGRSSGNIDRGGSGGDVSEVGGDEDKDFSTPGEGRIHRVNPRAKRAPARKRTAPSQLKFRKTSANRRRHRAKDTAIPAMATEGFMVRGALIGGLGPPTDFNFLL